MTLADYRDKLQSLMDESRRKEGEAIARGLRPSKTQFDSGCFYTGKVTGLMAAIDLLRQVRA